MQRLDEEGRIDKIECLCVDTCQMWLEGWSHVLASDLEDEIERVVLLPGDLVKIGDKPAFFQNLRNFIDALSPKMYIGQFKIKDATSGKALIDQYGIYPLLANWFPMVSHTIHRARIERPRSEFLNIDKTLLKKLLQVRSFAYEQTLNMIVRIIETPEKYDLSKPGPNEPYESMG